MNNFHQPQHIMSDHKQFFPEQLKQAALFQGLPLRQLSDIWTIGQVLKVKRNQTIFVQGEQAKALYIILNGQVKVFKLSLEGKEQILHILGPGEPFGEVPAFAGQTFPAHAQALQDSELLYIPMDGLLTLCKKDPSLVFNMLALLAARLRQFVTLIENLTLKAVPQRLAAYLLHLHDKHDSLTIDLDIAKGTLASFIGATPEALSRALKRMNRQGLLKVNGRTIQLCDLTGLSSLAKGE